MFWSRREGAAPPDAGSRNEQPAHPGGLTRDHVMWAYRLLLDREPESEDVIAPKLAGSANTAELRRHLMASAEFQANNPDFAHTNDRSIVIKELAPGGPRLFIDLSDHVIGLNILRERYERDEIAFVQRTLRPGDTAIDVGAHIGFFTIQMAAAVGGDGHVYAFEPFDGNAELLERSITENGFADRIVFARAAVAAERGSARLTFPVETLNSGGAYLLAPDAAPLTGNQTRTVPVVALDYLNVAGRVRLIKLDVEGAEPQVLKGAARLLHDHRPVILSELHPVQLARASGITAQQYLDQISGLGYRAHRVENGEPGVPLERAPDEALTSVILVPA